MVLLWPSTEVATEQRTQVAGADSGSLGDDGRRQVLGRMPFEQAQGADDRCRQRLIGKGSGIERGQALKHGKQQSRHCCRYAIGCEVLRTEFRKPAQDRVVGAQAQHPCGSRKASGTAAEDHEPRTGAVVTALVMHAAARQQKQTALTTDELLITNCHRGLAVFDQYQLITGMVVEDRGTQHLTTTRTEDLRQPGERRSVRISRRRITGQRDWHRVGFQHGPLPPVLHP